jgi:hypothetical protein
MSLTGTIGEKRDKTRHSRGFDCLKLLAQAYVRFGSEASF